MEPVLGILGIISTVGWIASEVIGMNPKWKSNSVLQVVFEVGKALSGLRKK